MSVIYFYIPSEKLQDIIDCGLKLSEWKTRQQATPWDKTEKPCFTASLHPRDDFRYTNSRYKCIKLDISTDYCIVADSDLYRLSLEHQEMKQYYIDSMVPLKNYVFGSFRKPECLVFASVMAEQISCLGKGLDDPVLYENSELLYVSNILETYNDKFSDFNQTILYSFLALQEQNGLIQCIRGGNNRLAVFFDREGKKYITVRIPEFKNYGVFLQEKGRL